MATQTQKGKAFEYACLKALKDDLALAVEVVIEATDAYKTAKSFYEGLDVILTDKMNP